MLGFLPCHVNVRVMSVCHTVRVSHLSLTHDMSG